MNGELYLKKGMLQLNKKLYNEALETLNKEGKSFART